MSGRRLVFVDRPSDAARPVPGTTVVVLDAAWTPPPGADDSPVAIRPLVRAILDEVDVLHESLAALDAWVAAGGLPDAFEIDGVAWWYRARMLLRWDVHELYLWRLVLDRLEAASYGAIVAPSGRPFLVAAARSLVRGVEPGDGPEIEVVRPRPPAQRFLRRNRRRLQEFVDRFRPASAAEPARRAILESRLEAIGRQPGGALALTWPRAFQVLREHGLDRRVDPYLVGALDRLAADGEHVTSIGLGLDHADDADWSLIEADPRLLPESFLVERVVGPEGDPSEPTALTAAIERAARVPYLLNGVDLGPALAGVVAGYGGRWLGRQRSAQRAAEATLAAVRPEVLFTDREASRTAWLAAGRQAGVRSVAIQHGMIYPNSPEYFQAPRAGRVRPDLTCVFGEYERELLVTGAGFQPDAVVVTGSPRPLELRDSGDGQEREDVRRELGVAAANRMLLVSVAHNELLGELHTFGILERTLGGPLPGVHVVIKLHPQDHAEPRHAVLLEGLAAAGGYQRPPISLVRDMDVYRLLRAADAHLGQFSTVLSDAVVAGTPNMIAVGHAYPDLLGYVAAGVATPVRSVADVLAVLSDVRPPTADARRRFLEAHYRPGDATDRLAGLLRGAISAARAQTSSGPGAGPPGSTSMASRLAS